MPSIRPPLPGSPNLPAVLWCGADHPTPLIRPSSPSFSLGAVTQHCSPVGHCWPLGWVLPRVAGSPELDRNELVFSLFLGKKKSTKRKPNFPQAFWLRGQG